MAVGLLCHQWEVCLESQRILCMQPIYTSLKEADNRTVLHIRDAMILRNKHEILVRTVDSDVIIILLGFFPQFLHCLWTTAQATFEESSTSTIAINTLERTMPSLYSPFTP